MADGSDTPKLKRAIGFRDLVLFYLVSGLSIRWIATAAATGSGAIAVWLIAFVCFFLPLAASVLELSSRYPQEGGMYVWTRHAFGDFAGFMTGWMYCTSNLPYFPGILYFAASMALYTGPRHWQHLGGSRMYFMAFSILALALITLLNVVGLGVGKWVNNIGAIGMWLPVLILMGMAAVSWVRFGSATHFTLAGMAPSTSWKGLLFLSTIFFAYGGCEAGSFMCGEIRNPRQTIPPALVVGGALIALGYLGGTAAMLIALPSSAIGGLGGFMQAIATMAGRIGWKSSVPLVATLVTTSSLGAAGAYLSATARLPFVAGIDNYLPPAFGRVHPKWHTPYVALAIYGLAGALFAILGQAGTTVRGAYDVLVSMAVITYFLPYLLLFAALIRLQSTAAPIRAIFREAFEHAGLPYFHPHSLRKTLARLGEQTCQSPEAFKAWSQNLGHEQVLTTFMSYGKVATERQGEIIRGLGAIGQTKPPEVEDIAEAVIRRLQNAGMGLPGAL